MAPGIAVIEQKVEDKRGEKQEHKMQIIWFNVLHLLLLHLGILYVAYLTLTFAADVRSIMFAYMYAIVGGIGITAGAHRLWSHRSYKAKWPLRALLCILFSMMGQTDIYEWSRDHRVHHKYAETDADPHNIKRGFFFAHIGWLMCKKHPAVAQKGKSIYLGDLLADPIVRFDRRFHIPMMLIFCYILPTMIPVWFWGDDLWTSFVIAGVGRHCVSLHYTFAVNSVAHSFGDQPYDKSMEARENAAVAFLVNGEGWHNYHHAFPWDYATSELGNKLNLTKIFIDFMALIGQAYDLKTAHPELVKNRKLRTGDGTRLKEVEN